MYRLQCKGGTLIHTCFHISAVIPYKAPRSSLERRGPTPSIDHSIVTMELRLLLPLLLSSPILAAQLHWRSHLSSNGTDFNGTAPFPGSGHNTTIPEFVPAANCRFSDQGLFENITLNCRDAISAVQTCPKAGASVRDLLRAATAFSDCFEKQLYESYACKYWAPRKDGAISLWKPFGHPTLVEPYFQPEPVPTVEKGDCDWPDFLPVRSYISCIGSRTNC
jgi:hypothetical protein